MPIHCGAIGGKINLMRYLVEELKCDPMSASDYLDTPLHCAAAHGHLDIVKYLLEEQKCNPCSENVYRYTPFPTVQYLICEKKIPFSIIIMKF